MKKFASVLLLMIFAVVVTTADAQAGRNKRGWYLKRPGANCVIRTVAVSGYNGTVAVRKVRVCR